MLFAGDGTNSIFMLGQAKIVLLCFITALIYIHFKPCKFSYTYMSIMKNKNCASLVKVLYTPLLHVNESQWAFKIIRIRSHIVL